MTKIFIFLSIFISLVGFSNSTHSKTKTPQELNREFLETSKKWKTYGDIIENISQNVSPEEAQWLKNQNPSLASKKYYQPQINKSETAISYPNLNLTLEIVSVEKITFKINRKTWIHDPTLKLDQAFEKLRQLLAAKVFSIIDRAEAEETELDRVTTWNYIMSLGHPRTCENQLNGLLRDYITIVQSKNQNDETASHTYKNYCTLVKELCGSHNISHFNYTVNEVALSSADQLNCTKIQRISRKISSDSPSGRTK